MFKAKERDVVLHPWMPKNKGRKPAKETKRPPLEIPQTRGFASMESEKQREISRKGGQASHRNRDRQQSSGHKNEGTDRKED